MEFGIFSNGFRPHTSASRTYEEDLSEIVLADQLGFRDAYLRVFAGSNDDAQGLVVTELIPFPSSLLASPGEGAGGGDA